MSRMFPYVMSERGHQCYKRLASMLCVLFSVLSGVKQKCLTESRKIKYMQHKYRFILAMQLL